MQTILYNCPSPLNLLYFFLTKEAEQKEEGELLSRR